MSFKMKAKDFKNIVEFVKDDVDIIIGCNSIENNKEIKKVTNCDGSDIRCELVKVCNEYDNELNYLRELLQSIYEGTTSPIDGDDIMNGIQLTFKGNDIIREIIDNHTCVDTKKLIDFNHECMTCFEKYYCQKMLKLFSKIIYLSEIINNSDTIKTNECNRKTELVDKIYECTDKLFTLLKQDLNDSVIDPVNHRICEKYIKEMQINRYYNMLDEIDDSGVVSKKIIKEHRLQGLEISFDNLSKMDIVIKLSTKFELYRLITLYMDLFYILEEEE